MNTGSFFAELKRRNVYKVAVAYAVAAWLLIQIATQVFPFFEAPNWAVRLVVLLLVLGFPVALILAWAFELTPEGIKRAETVARPESIRRATGRKLDFLIIGILLLVIGLFAYGHFGKRAPVSPSPLPTASAALNEKSIAVLPFENLSRDPDNAFFADGVQDAILADLAKVADLKVISRTSVMQYKNAGTRNLREVGQQLGVAHVLEGSVQRIGGKVRVSAQLINASTDAHEWAENYDRPVDDVFAIQSEIAKKIADQLQAKISPREKMAMSRTPTTDLAANRLYLQAKDLFRAASNDPNGNQGLAEGVRVLDEAVTHDPQFLLAYCLLARTHLEIYWEGFDHTPARREMANIAIQNASRIEPDAGEVHLALADYAYHGFRDYDRARAELDLARNLLPNEVDALDLTALIDRRQGRWAEATRNLERATELDPLNFGLLSNATTTAGTSRRYPEAIRLAQRALKIFPRDYAMRLRLALMSFDERADTRPLRDLISTVLTEEPAAAEKIAFGLFYLALAERDSSAMTRALAAIPSGGKQMDGSNFPLPREYYAGLSGRAFNDMDTARNSFTAARVIVEKVVREQPEYAPAWGALGLIDAGLGDKDRAASEGRRACELLPLSRDAVGGPPLITNLAVIYAWTGEKDMALEQLAISAQIPCGVTYGSLKLNPQWDSLRGDPPFQKIVDSLAPKKVEVMPAQASANPESRLVWMRLGLSQLFPCRI